MSTMEETASALIGFTPSAGWVFLGVLIALGIVAKLVMDLVIKSRELRKPKVTDEKDIQEKLKNDNDRLKRLEDKTEQQEEELKLILRSQMVIIHHMIDGNGTQSLKETQQDIEDYLITGKVREKKGE